MVAVPYLCVFAFVEVEGCEVDAVGPKDSHGAVGSPQDARRILWTAHRRLIIDIE